MRRAFFAVLLLIAAPARADIATLFGWGATLPSSCAEPQLFLDTDAPSGRRIYGCESGVFVLQGSTTGANGSIEGELALFDDDTGKAIVGGGCIDANKDGNLVCETVATTDKTVAPGNRSHLLENDSALTPDPTCANSGVADALTWLDSDEANGVRQWDQCSDQVLVWRTPATSTATTEFLASTATAGVMDFRVIATGDLPAAGKKHVCDFNIEAPVTGDNGVFQCHFPEAATLNRVYCNTTVDTSVVQLYERTEAAPGTGTTGMLTADLTCDADGASTTDFADTAIAADALLALGLKTTFTTGVVRVHVEATVN